MYSQVWPARVAKTRSCGRVRPVAKSLTRPAPPGPGTTSATVPRSGWETSSRPSGVAARKRAPGIRAYTATVQPSGTLSSLGRSNGGLSSGGGTVTRVGRSASTRSLGGGGGGAPEPAPGPEPPPDPPDPARAAGSPPPEEHAAASATLTATARARAPTVTARLAPSGT